MDEAVAHARVWLRAYPPGVPADIDVTRYTSLVQAFDEWIDKYRERVAFVSLGSEMTYAEVARQAHAFAAWLQSQGVRKGERVALMMPNCFQYPICLFGTLIAGGVVVNVNPLYTVRELKHQLVDSGARSVKGVPLYTRDIAEPNAQVRVLVIGAIHGDELTSATLAMHWIALAADEKMEMPQPVHWRFVPIVNPDGMLAKPHKRTNADGVDLNRNFPTPDWERDASVYWEKRTHKDPRRWPGPKPLSEPETRFVLDQVEHFRPHLIVSIHAPFGVLDFDGPTVPPSKLGRLYLDQVGIYPGSLGNYGGVHKGVPVITIELANALRAPREAEMRQMWLDLLRWTAAKIHADRGR